MNNSSEYRVNYRYFDGAHTEEVEDIQDRETSRSFLRLRDAADFYDALISGTEEEDKGVFYYHKSPYRRPVRDNPAVNVLTCIELIWVAEYKGREHTHFLNRCNMTGSYGRARKYILDDPAYTKEAR